MSRLTAEWICGMERSAPQWNSELKARTGIGFMELAAFVSGHGMDKMRLAAKSMKVAAIPITSGLGIIGKFAESVAAIIGCLGFETFVTQNTDVDGLYEASLRGADIVFMADDNRYIALNLLNGKISDNNIATSAGYSKLLRTIAGGLEGRDVAILGYGIIGQLLSQNLKRAGANIAVYDKDLSKRAAVEANGYEWIYDSNSDHPQAALRQYQYIADATCEGEWLKATDCHPQALIVAPGVPFSFDKASAEVLGSRCIHDVLEIGTVCMLGLAI